MVCEKGVKKSARNKILKNDDDEEYFALWWCLMRQRPRLRRHQMKGGKDINNMPCLLLFGKSAPRCARKKKMHTHSTCLNYISAFVFYSSDVFCKRSLTSSTLCERVKPMPYTIFERVDEIYADLPACRLVISHIMGCFIDVLCFNACQTLPAR